MTIAQMSTRLYEIKLTRLEQVVHVPFWKFGSEGHPRGLVAKEDGGISGSNAIEPTIATSPSVP